MRHQQGEWDVAGFNADALRNRRAAQFRIKHYCSCGRMVVGNPGWASHQRANPEHRDIGYKRWCEIQDSKP